jgi:hypothetical protein
VFLASRGSLADPDDVPLRDLCAVLKMDPIGKRCQENGVMATKSELARSGGGKCVGEIPYCCRYRRHILGLRVS